MQILAEMLGTFILMFSICGIITSTRLTGGGAALLEYATTAGLTIVVLIFSIGSISGAHVNPAVTIAFAAFGHFQWSRVLHNLLSSNEEFTFFDINREFFLTGTTLHTGTNSGFCFGNIYGRVYLWHKIRSYGNPARPRLRSGLLGGAHCQFHCRVCTCSTNTPITICKGTAIF